MANAMGVTWRGVRSESVKAEGFDMNHVRIVLFALCKVFCLYTSWEPSKELYHSTENFSEVAVQGSALSPWSWWLRTPWPCDPQALPYV